MITQASVKCNKQDIFVNRDRFHIDGFVTILWQYDHDRTHQVSISFRSDWFQEFELAMSALYYDCWPYLLDIRDNGDTLEIDFELNGHQAQPYQDPTITWQKLYDDQNTRDRVNNFWDTVASRLELTALHTITD